MEYKNTKNRVKAALGFQVNLEQMTLEDGITIVEAELFEPDYSIGIVTADGVVPMPIGEYTLQDGKIVVVAVEGIISEIKDAMPEEPLAEEVPQVEIEVEAINQAPQAKRIVESVSKESFFAEIEKLRTEMSAQIEELKAEKLALEVKLSSQEEGAAPIVPNPEKVLEKNEGFLYGQSRTSNIQDSVYEKMFS